MCVYMCTLTHTHMYVLRGNIKELLNNGISCLLAVGLQVVIFFFTLYILQFSVVGIFL